VKRLLVIAPVTVYLSIPLSTLAQKGGGVNDSEGHSMFDSLWSSHFMY